MKYNVFCFDSNETAHETTVSVRSDARIGTVYSRLGQAMYAKLREDGLIAGRGTINYQLPNIWTNGGFGSMWITTEAGLFDVFAVREDGLNYL